MNSSKPIKSRPIVNDARWRLARLKKLQFPKTAAVQAGIIAASVTVGLFIIVASIPDAFAQGEIRGTYIIRIPATNTTANQEAVHYEPAEIAIPVGTTIMWFNDDPLQPHTVTSGSPEAGDSGDLFDSSFMSEGSIFQHTFDEPGNYTYYCQFHQNAVGRILVSDFFEQGDNFRLSYGTAPTFDFTEQERTLLVFEPTSMNVPQDEPATYRITILKDGQERFSEEFQTLGGKLYLELVPTDDEARVTGPDISDPVIGTYHVSGTFLKDNAAYTIRSEITQLSDAPLEQPLADEFGVRIVPEFSKSVLLAVVAGIGASIFAGTILRRHRFFGSHQA